MSHSRNMVPRCDIESLARIIVERLGGRWRAPGAMCACPAHDDRHPSLSVRLGDRSLLFKCFAGCPTIEVVQALHASGLLDGAPIPVTGEPAASRADAAGRSRAALRLWDAREASRAHLPAGT